MIGKLISQHEYSVGLARARTNQDMEQLAKEYLTNKLKESKMAKMASLHAEGYTDKKLEELSEAELAEILEDILID
jgi:hypothetical protein